MSEYIKDAIVLVLGFILRVVILGTTVYYIWPIAISAAFPGLVTRGIISSHLSWFEAICLSLLTWILIRPLGAKK